MENINKPIQFNSDGFFKSQGKSVYGGIVVGVLFIAVHGATVLNLWSVFTDPSETKGMFYFGAFLVAISLFVLLTSKSRSEKQRTTFDVYEDKLIITNGKGYEIENIAFADYLIKGKITRANLGKTVTCTLKLEDRIGKKRKVHCALDERTFTEMMNVINQNIDHATNI